MRNFDVPLFYIVILVAINLVLSTWIIWTGLKFLKKSRLMRTDPRFTGEENGFKYYGTLMVVGGIIAIFCLLVAFFYFG